MFESKRMCELTCGKEDGMHKNLSMALLLVRLGIAATFIFHGWMKFENMPVTISFFAQLGFPFYVAYFVTLVEVGAGVAMLLGIMTRLAGALLAVEMLVAIYTVHIKFGFDSTNGGYEWQLLLVLCSLAVMLAGPGMFSLHHNICKKAK